MSRYLVSLPEQFNFETRHRITYGELNPGNHLAADKVITLALDANYELFAALGYSDPRDIEGGWLFMANSQVDYISETGQGQELVIRISVSQPSEKSLDFTYSLRKPDKGKEVARVLARNVYFDLRAGKSARVPQAFLDKLTAIGPAGN